MGSFIEKTYWLRANMLKQYFTGLALVKAKIWGIQMGRKCTFRGPVLFYKTPKSIVLIGENCRFNSLSYFNFRGLDHPTILQTGKANAKIKIGNNCGFSSVSIVCDVEVNIGNNVMCGANVIIGDRNDHEERYAKTPKPIIIDDDVWIGMNATIMGGVTIGKGSIIGANALVTKNVPPMEVWGGIPAKFIKKINND